ncbi:TPA: hypothetical protein HA265_01940 [Candidatus Woesearchaeota archaeon]|nr:hypothetical protein [Candidatus Woesearchaeota archaeon]
MRVIPLFAILLLVIFSASAMAATLHGTVYDDELNELNDVVVEVNSTPQQRYVSKDGSYTFNLLPGTYSITARYNKDDIYSYSSEDAVTITDDGDFVFDLFLFADLDEAIELIEDSEDISINGETEDMVPSQQRNIGVTAVVTAFVILMAVLVYAYYWRKKKEREEAKEIDRVARTAKQRAREHPPDKKVKKVLEELELKEKVEKEQHLATETQIILDILKKEGGRSTQKEIRKYIPLSEAKISLMIAELESQGKIKKVKKGRGNIIILN